MVLVGDVVVVGDVLFVQGVLGLLGMLMFCGLRIVDNGLHADACHNEIDHYWPLLPI